jgi:hypothetical protein
MKCKLSDQTRPYRSSVLVCFYSLQCVSAVQFSHHQVGVGYTDYIECEAYHEFSFLVPVRADDKTLARQDSLG